MFLFQVNQFSTNNQSKKTILWICPRVLWNNDTTNDPDAETGHDRNFMNVCKAFFEFGQGLTDIHMAHKKNAIYEKTVHTSEVSLIIKTYNE